ncbi:MAG: cation-transporting P-type ATPase [Blastocatellia bacterium]
MVRTDAQPEIIPHLAPHAPELLNAPHAQAAEAVAQAQGVNPATGLSSDEAARRLEQFGANAIQQIRPRAAWRLLLDQFASLIIGLLAVAALVAFLTSDFVEGLAIVVVLILNALIGFAMEWQAGRALDALRRTARTTARVRRDGREAMMDALELVPGDVVVLNPGDRVPADARLLHAASLRVEESALTGESASVEKSAAPAAADAPVAERYSMLYLGTSVTAGRAVAVVTATGGQTELGRIGKLVADAPDEPTPLEQRLATLGRQLVWLMLVIMAVVVVAGVLRGDNWWMMVEVAISLAVAAVPEGLPAVTTLILAIGVLRMARQRAIVRRLPAVETLGSATIICTDKTGTLTENRMTVIECRLADGRVVSIDERTNIENDDLLFRTVRASVLCNEASFETQASGAARTIGDPTETALLENARLLGLNVSELRADYQKLAEIPFDAVTRRMLTVHAAPDGTQLYSLKGAPSAVMGLCRDLSSSDGEVMPLDEAAQMRLLTINEAMADRALRVLALAEKRLPPGAYQKMPDWSENDFTFLGFVGMIDPPRAEVPQAVARAHTAGIRVVMLTGDQINTARAIARELRLNDRNDPLVLHARDLDGTDHTALADLARRADAFARVSPEDKMRIVEALQQTGEIVALTGDGVNDAPALKRADTGIAMGQRGTEVAREAADVVLTDDNFATILHAIEGGRIIYSNIGRFVHLMFSKNLAEVLLIFAALLIGWPLPLLPLQILWINLVTDIFPGLALAVEPGGPDVMRRRPASPQASLLSSDFIRLIVWQGVMLTAIIMGAYGWALNEYGPGAHARTMALFALIGVQLGHTFNCRSRTRSAFDGLFRNPWVWLAAALVVSLQLLAVWFGPLARLLDVTRLTTRDWMITGLSVISPILIVEITKLVARRRLARQPQAEEIMI